VSRGESRIGSGGVGRTQQAGLGLPEGREAGFGHPAVVVTAQRILDADPAVVQVVPLTTTIRRFMSEITVEPDNANGLQQVSAAQCQHIRAVSTGRIEQVRGNVGPTGLNQIRATIGLILDIPG
jgi:mRNA interferase MazF